MENASKALLIAAGVLIVILLVALGMRIYNSSGDTSTQAAAVGKDISDQGTEAAKSASASIQSIGASSTFTAKDNTNVSAKEAQEIITAAKNAGCKIISSSTNPDAITSITDMNSQYHISFTYKDAKPSTLLVTKVTNN